MGAFYKTDATGTWKVGDYCAVPAGTCVLRSCNEGHVIVETMEGRGLLPEQLLTEITKENGETYKSKEEFFDAVKDFFKQE